MLPEFTGSYREFTGFAPFTDINLVTLPYMVKGGGERGGG